MAIVKIDMDIYFEYYGTPGFHDDLAKHNISHELIELEGPAGGNPYVYLFGEEENMKALLTEILADEDEVNFYLYGEE